MLDKSILFIYHGGSCADGFACRWLAVRKFGHNADYVAMNPGEFNLSPGDCTGKVVYIVDLCFSIDVLEAIALEAMQVVLLDHHTTALGVADQIQASEVLAPQLETPSALIQGVKRFHYQIDQEYSGCGLLWRFWYGVQQAPWIVEYVQDRDLWRWQLPNSREINAALRAYPQEFEMWQRLDMTVSAHGLIQEGRAILLDHKQIIESQIRGVRTEDIGGHLVPTVNATALISETLERLCEDVPHLFACSWYERSDGKKQWSLRSGPQGLDVSVIAQAYGGGGHTHAAGFVTGE